MNNAPDFSFTDKASYPSGYPNTHHTVIKVLLNAEILWKCKAIENRTITLRRKHAQKRIFSTQSPVNDRTILNYIPLNVPEC